MALDVFFRGDIAQGIRAVAMAMLSSAVAHGGSNIEYCRGILDTIRAQAMAFGIPWTEVSADLTRVLADAGRDDLLEIITRALPQG